MQTYLAINLILILILRTSVSYRLKLTLQIRNRKSQWKTFNITHCSLRRIQLNILRDKNEEMMVAWSRRVTVNMWNKKAPTKFKKTEQSFICIQFSVFKKHKIPTNIISRHFRDTVPFKPITIQALKYNQIKFIKLQIVPIYTEPKKKLQNK